MNKQISTETSNKQSLNEILKNFGIELVVKIEDQKIKGTIEPEKALDILWTVCGLKTSFVVKQLKPQLKPKLKNIIIYNKALDREFVIEASALGFDTSMFEVENKKLDIPDMDLSLEFEFIR
ncbi:MAG: hypothetical protein ACTSPH_07890 [Promethearchaeota archaeon]